MSTLAFYSKIEALPEHLQQQVLDYIEFLLSRERNQHQRTPALPETPPDSASETKPALEKTSVSALNSSGKALSKEQGSTPPIQKTLIAGFLKGSFVMAADFDAPLEDFKEYM